MCGRVGEGAWRRRGSGRARCKCARAHARTHVIIIIITHLSPQAAADEQQAAEVGARGGVKLCFGSLCLCVCVGGVVLIKRMCCATPPSTRGGGRPLPAISKPHHAPAPGCTRPEVCCCCCCCSAGGQPKRVRRGTSDDERKCGAMPGLPDVVAASRVVVVTAGLQVRIIDAPCF